jgi:hypothetical protein
MHHNLTGIVATFSIFCYKKTDSMQESVFICANYEYKLVNSEISRRVGKFHQLGFRLNSLFKR